MSEKLKLSELIRRGSEVVGETRVFTERKSDMIACKACAVSTAWIAKMGTTNITEMYRNADGTNEAMIKTIAEDLGCPVELIGEISAKHWGGTDRLSDRRRTGSKGIMTVDAADAFPTQDGCGLTKLEYFSVAILQGLVSHPEMNGKVDILAKDSVKLAKALIAELNNKP